MGDGDDERDWEREDYERQQESDEEHYRNR